MFVDQSSTNFFIQVEGAVVDQEQRTCLSNMMCVPLYTSLFRQPAAQAKQVEFNAQKFRGHMTMATPIFENFSGSCPDCPREHACQI